ncbi:hypothetical protein L593_13875 [Salinarchaeum sp. Harcht-Bsk1]|uniref:hypothetical protein n=1 Tax=Salinarchaeum sp. Harcht-Bsk1 TaxID=1333523 RepID=UPI000342383D|nr:hypothetical protein [Salinarchaeum sp. Harcht-Bsk1]AGN02714.1 hypothetical protein L593_13875 [Salinarchaeum sp. Harcht-Bsk1]
MGALRDSSRFLFLLSLAGASYLLIAEGYSFDDRVVAVVTFGLGIFAVVLIAYRFREDFAYEDEQR